MQILFITSTRIGDAVLSSGLLGALIERHPEARLTIACGALAAPLFAEVPGLERLHVVRKKPGNRHWLELWRAAVGQRWDLAIDLRRSGLAYFLRASERRRLPRADGPLHRVVLLGRVRLFIGSDSGLMHLAAAAGAPTLGLFGPSPDALYAPWGPKGAVARTETSS